MCVSGQKTDQRLHIHLFSLEYIEVLLQPMALQRLLQTLIGTAARVNMMVLIELCRPQKHCSIDHLYSLKSIKAKGYFAL